MVAGSHPNVQVEARQHSATFLNGKDVPVTVWSMSREFYKGDRPLAKEEQPQMMVARGNEVYGDPDGDGSAGGARFGTTNLEGSKAAIRSTVTEARLDRRWQQRHHHRVGRPQLRWKWNDRIQALDGNVDKIDCDTGTDTVRYETDLDTVRAYEIKNP